ncbi:hypothetical protein F4810DRAFT_659155 [Camillea tinctor]|nr:hypothetical protein F4810DRAFT_659155 [Camillea tinctor]
MQFSLPTSSILPLLLLSIPMHAHPLNPRMEVSDIYKQTLTKPGCTNIRLEGSTLKALCTAVNPAAEESSLDLNTCFANYAGALTRVSDKQGGYAGSCSACQLSGTKLACECGVGAGGRAKHSEVELDDWETLQVNDAGALQCESTFGVS